MAQGQIDTSQFETAGKDAFKKAMSNILNRPPEEIPDEAVALVTEKIQSLVGNMAATSADPSRSAHYQENLLKSVGAAQPVLDGDSSSPQDVENSNRQTTQNRQPESPYENNRSSQYGNERVDPSQEAYNPYPDYENPTEEEGGQGPGTPGQSKTERSPASQPRSGNTDEANRNAWTKSQRNRNQERRNKKKADNLDSTWDQIRKRYNMETLSNADLLKDQVLEDAEKLGKYLGEQIKKGNSSAFAIALGLAILKDGVDLLLTVVTAGVPYFILNFIIGPAIGVALWAIMITSAGFVKRLLLKRAALYIAGQIVEVIPLLNLAPTNTILMLLLLVSIQKEVAKMKHAKRDVDEFIKKTQRNR